MRSIRWPGRRPSLYAAQAEFRQTASRRLAFRELGLAIGIQALDVVRAELDLEPERFARRDALGALLDALSAHAPLGAALESFWLDPEHRQTRTWNEHRDINEVMLATSLLRGVRPRTRSNSRGSER